MSKSCEAPIHASVDESDHKHPLFAEYMQYRAAMSRQLVSCNSFKNWLYQKEQSENSDRINAHPRVKEYRIWLRQHVNIQYPTAQFIDFWQWLKENN